MHTHSKSIIFRPKHRADISITTTCRLHNALFSAKEPRGFKTASKDPSWSQTMHDELRALHEQNTWDLVPRPSSSNVVGSKWIFRTKYKADDTVDRLKACLVAQGFNQIPGFDFSHTFSPVIKASTLRIVLSLAVVRKWHL
ncbi:uncharacterized mitochondrial protein AtMg00820-like [Lactuca sativa]|uniref:uncharacterized mitochondrial protein AtMg00820-like n=1 Tax=Lactuca sativa TaxID=4236 RepID=UPI000CD9F259|nr:uncharacterized mitochondrial protein AtMg00820-like [Lactuca sativa]